MTASSCPYQQREPSCPETDRKDFYLKQSISPHQVPLHSKMCFSSCPTVDCLFHTMMYAHSVAQ